MSYIYHHIIISTQHSHLAICRDKSLLNILLIKLRIEAIAFFIEGFRTTCSHPTIHEQEYNPNPYLTLQMSRNDKVFDHMSTSLVCKRQVRSINLSMRQTYFPIPPNSSTLDALLNAYRWCKTYFFLCSQSCKTKNIFPSAHPYWSGELMIIMFGISYPFQIQTRTQPISAKLQLAGVQLLPSFPPIPKKEPYFHSICSWLPVLFSLPIRPRKDVICNFMEPFDLKPRLIRIVLAISGIVPKIQAEDLSIWDQWRFGARLARSIYSLLLEYENFQVFEECLTRTFIILEIEYLECRLLPLEETRQGSKKNIRAV